MGSLLAAGIVEGSEGPIRPACVSVRFAVFGTRG